VKGPHTPVAEEVTHGAPEGEGVTVAVGVGAGVVGAGVVGAGLVGAGVVGAGLVGDALVGAGVVGAGSVGDALVDDRLIGDGPPVRGLQAASRRTAAMTAKAAFRLFTRQG
jgi:hypothetical protein